MTRLASRAARKDKNQPAIERALTAAGYLWWSLPRRPACEDAAMITKLLFPPPPEEPEEKDDPEFGDDEDDSDADYDDDDDIF